jgi:hypothetical protein
LGGGGNIDMIIIQGRLCPVGSVQVGSFCIVAACAETEEPVTINGTTARTKTVIRFLLACICYSPLIEVTNDTNTGTSMTVLDVRLYTSSYLSMWYKAPVCEDFKTIFTHWYDMMIRNNTVYGNGGIDIICSLDCYNILIENNKVHDNADSGIMFSRNITNSIEKKYLVIFIK